MVFYNLALYQGRHLVGVGDNSPSLLRLPPSKSDLPSPQGPHSHDFLPKLALARSAPVTDCIARQPNLQEKIK